MSRRNTTSYREKGRAVFLAAMMVLSVVAMSAAFAGGAAAVEQDGDHTLTVDVTDGVDDLDVEVTVQEADNGAEATDETGDDGSVNFDVTDGDYDIGIDEDGYELYDDSVTIDGDDQSHEAELESDTDGPSFEGDVSFEPESPEDGDDVTATVDVENTGDESGDVAVEFEFDDETEVDETLSLDVDESDDEDAELGELDEGDYDWELTLDTEEAESDSLSVSGDGGEFTPTGDAEDIEYIHDGSVAWQGQDVIAYDGEIGAEYDVGDDVELREVTDMSDQETSFEEELSVEEADDAGVAEVVEEEVDIDDASEVPVVVAETDDLEEEYYIVDADLTALDADSEWGSNLAFEVSVQDLDTEFDDDSVTDGGADSDTDLDIDSSRGDYSINTSADGDLDEAELLSIFVNNESVENALLEDDVRDAITFDNDDNAQIEHDDADTLSQLVEEEVDLDDEEYEDIDADDIDDENDFNAAAFNTDEDDADEMIVLYNIDDREEAVDFNGIDEDDYTFNFEVSDTEAESSNDITVAESDAEADFDQGVYSQSAGDPIHMTVDLEDTDEAYLTFGDQDSGYFDIIYIEDDEDNGEVNLTLNPRVMGTGSPYAVAADDDIAESLIDDHGVENPGDLDAQELGGNFEDLELYDDEDMDDGDEATFIDLLDEFDLADNDEPADAYDQLIRPLQATDYPLASTEDGVIVADDDDELDLDDELDAASVDLIQPELGEVTTHVAPEDSADEHDLAELLGDEDDDATLTERTGVAEDDRLIVQAEATGIYGLMVQIANEGDYDPLTEDGFHPSVIDELNEQDGEGVTIEIEETDSSGNQEANHVDFEDADQDDVQILANHIEGEMYIVVDTSSSSAFDSSIDEGDTFEATFEYEADEDERYYFGGDSDRPWLGGADDTDDDPESQDAAFPYFQTEEEQSVTTSVDIEEQDVTFDNLDEDDNVQIETSDESLISGETNVAPGSEGEVRITDAGDTDSFLVTEDAEIDSDGDFESDAIDFDDRETDDEAEIEFRISGSDVGTADGIFVEELPEDDADDADDADDTDDAPSDDDADEPAPSDDDTDDAPTDDDTDDVSDEDDSIPGFGVAVAVVALLAAAMLALRRQH